LIFLSDDGGTGWGSHYGTNVITKVDVPNKTVSATTPVDARPNTMIRDSKGRIFVTNDAAGKVTILDSETLQVLEVIDTPGLIPAGLALNKDETKLYVAAEGQVDVIEVVQEDKDIYELLAELIETVEGYEFENAIENSYMANLKKIEEFLNSAKYVPAENQLRAFIKKVEQDYKVGKITESQYEDLTGRAEAILELVPEDAFGTVPLMTQVVSPYPSLEETSSWASATYADGRANKPKDCGLTIAQCGCAITSLAMVGKNYGIENGIDGTATNPLNMNSWLLNGGESKGYDAVGNIMWGWGLAYLGEEKSGKYMSRLSIDTASTSDTTKILDFIERKGPALGFNKPKGHWMVLTGTTDTGYSVNDPYWYNTKTTDDERTDTDTMQDYDDVVTKAALFSYRPELKPIQELLEFSLNSPAHLRITDERGRSVGYDTVTGQHLSEIPNGTYDPEYAILNQSNPASDPHYAKHLMLVEPEGSAFELEVIGTGEGSYSLTTAVSDGAGDFFGKSVAGETSLGEVHRFTVLTNLSDDSLPGYLENILNLIPASEQKKFIQAFKVVFSQTEKGHVAVTETLVENLIRYVENQYGKTSWRDGVVEALENLLITR
jgi:hypothetical protein